MFKFYTKKAAALLMLVICSVFVSQAAFAQTPLAIYTFTGATGSEDSLAVDAQPANAFFSKTGRATLTGTNAANVYNSTTVPLSPTIDLASYISFSGRPNPGYSLTMTSLELFVQRSATGPKTAEIRSSADNYASTLLTIDLTANANGTFTALLPAASFTNLTTETTFRIYPFNAGSATGTFRIDNLKIFGTVQPAGNTPTLNFAAATSSVAENVPGGTFNIPVTITNPSATVATTVTISLATPPGTATTPDDYILTTTTLTFPAGSSADQNVVLTIIDDALIEGDETINLILTSPSAGAVLGSNITHTVTILDDDVTAPIVGFQTATVSVSEAAGTISIPVIISNANATATSVDVILATPSGTATLGDDYTFTTQTLTFPAGSTTTQFATLTIIDDQIVDKNETIILTLANPTNNATIVGNTTYTITIIDNDLPLYTVAQVTTNHPTTFVADSINVVTRLTGVLYGDNQRPGGLTFALIDNTGGINLFKTTCTPATCPATPLVEGDSVMAYGKIAQFNGLTQMDVDSIHFIIGNRPLKAPAIVTVLDESTESELIKIVGPLTIVNPAQWTNSGPGFTVQVTDGTNTYDMRIDNDSDIFGTPAPTQSFSLTGIGGQFDSSSPFNSGYQILPRRLTDIELITGIKSHVLATSVSVYPNPARQDLTVALGEVKGATDLYIINTLGQVVAKTNATGETTMINVSNLPAGVYTLRVVQANKTAVKQFVKIN